MVRHPLNPSPLAGSSLRGCVRRVYSTPGAVGVNIVVTKYLFSLLIVASGMFPERTWVSISFVTAREVTGVWFL